MAESEVTRNAQAFLSRRLRDFPVTREALNATYPDITDIICGAFVFSTKGLDGEKDAIKPRVLLLQRASSKSEKQWPGTWDFPGGRYETSDPDLVAAVQREVLEEAGLHVSSLEEFVGITYWTKGPEFGNRKWGKFCFVVEVEETQDIAHGSLRKVPIKLSPREHQDYKWATEDMVKDGSLTFIGEDGNSMILKAFAKLKESRQDTPQQ